MQPHHLKRRATNIIIKQHHRKPNFCKPKKKVTNPITIQRILNQPQIINNLNHMYHQFLDMCQDHLNHPQMRRKKQAYQ